jgi:HK97 gp10 family phage protein
MPIEFEVDLDVNEVKRWLRERPAKTISELNRAVKASVISVEAETKRNAPVDTGTLKSSLSHTTQELEGEVVAAGVKYAIYQEYGTKYMRGRFFMTKAVRSLTNKINYFFKKAMENIAK